MIKLNIFEKIYEIMEEYENKKKNLINNYKNKEINKDFEQNIKENNFFENDFFKFIFNNIEINKINNINKKENNNIEKKEYYQENEENQEIYNENCINNNSLIISDDHTPEINITINNNLSIIKEYTKKIYKKILLYTHPDKNGCKELFIKCVDYYNSNLLIGLLYISYKIKINPPLLNEIIVQHIFFEIRIIQEKMKNNEF